MYVFSYPLVSALILQVSAQVQVQGILLAYVRCMQSPKFEHRDSSSFDLEPSLLEPNGAPHLGHSVHKHRLLYVTGHVRGVIFHVSYQPSHCHLVWNLDIELIYLYSS